jgi:hypothetical protein
MLSSALIAGALVWLTGCTSTGNYERTAARGETDLRGILEITTNAPAATIAVLHIGLGRRPPCRLRALNTSVADDLRALAAKGRIVIITGVARSEIFVVTAVREDGQRRRRPAVGDDDAAAPQDGFWSNITWGLVPASER